MRSFQIRVVTHDGALLGEPLSGMAGPEASKRVENLRAVEDAVVG
jgi:hypothetical protein